MGRPLPPTLLFVLVGASLASGCLGGTDGTDGEAPGPGATNPRIAAGTYKPWTVSDYWVYDMQVRGLERYTETKLVYYEESGPEFVVGTPRHDEALYHAVFSVNPILGRIHKEHLSPHERGMHAEMFPFEGGAIRDGHVWTTVFYEQQLRLSATYADDLETPMGIQPGFRIHGDASRGGLTVDYDYVRDVKWFTQLHVADADGTVLDLKLRETGTRYSGDAHFIRAKDLFSGTLTTGGLTPGERTFQVTAEHVDGHRVESFAISTDIQLQAGLNAVLRILDPQGNTIYERQYHDAASGEYDIRQVWPTGSDTTDQPLGSRPQWPAGTYTIRLSASGAATADITVVGTQDNSGSV